MARRTGFELCLNAGRGLFAGARLGGASSSSAGWMTCPAMYTQTRGAKKSTRRVEVMLTQVRRFGLFEQRERAVNGVNTRCDLSLRTTEVQQERIDRGSTAIVLRNAATFYISGLEPNLCFYPNTARATF